MHKEYKSTHMCKCNSSKLNHSPVPMVKSDPMNNSILLDNKTQQNILNPIPIGLLYFRAKTILQKTTGRYQFDPDQNRVKKNDNLMLRV